MADQLKTARMTNATIGDTIDNHMADLEIALAYILGIPIDTLITSPLFEVVAGGLKKIILQDAAADPVAAGQFLRRAQSIMFHDGAIVRELGGPSFIPLSGYQAIDGASTRYLFISGDADESRVQGIVPRDGRLQNLYVRSYQQPASGTAVFTVRINGVDTALTVTIAAGGGAIINQDATHSLNVVAGQGITLKAVNNAATLCEISGASVALV